MGERKTTATPCYCPQCRGDAQNSRTIAKAIAEANGFGHLWESYHPVVAQTVEWLTERGYLAAPAALDEPRGDTP